MCPIPLVHKHHIQIIQVAATPLQRGVEGDEQWVRLGEVLEKEKWEDNRRRMGRRETLSRALLYEAVFR